MALYDERRNETRRQNRQAAEQAVDAEERAGSQAAYAASRPTLGYSAQDAAWGDIRAAEEQQLADLSGYRDVLGRVPGLGMREMSGDAARSMAAAMGQAGGMARGGGQAASLRQQGLSTGRAKAGFLAETLPAVALARSEAAQQQAQVLADRGATAQDEMANAQNQIQTIRNLKLKGAESQAQRDMAVTSLLGLANASVDPAVRNMYLAEADRIMQYGQAVPFGITPGMTS